MFNNVKKETVTVEERDGEDKLIKKTVTTTVTEYEKDDWGKKFPPHTVSWGGNK